MVPTNAVIIATRINAYQKRLIQCCTQILAMMTGLVNQREHIVNVIMKDCHMKFGKPLLIGDHSGEHTYNWYWNATDAEIGVCYK